MNLLHKIHSQYSPLFLVLGLVLFLWNGNENSSLQAQVIPSSGYSGFFNRIQIGIGYSELVEDYEDEDRKYYGHGPHMSIQLGWAVSKNYAVHLNTSAFFASQVFGPERQERVDESIGRTEHEYLLMSGGLGFSWFHVPTAIYVSPVVNLLQIGYRTEMQKIDDLPGDDYSLIQLRTEYNTRVGYGLIIGNDRWLSKSLGLGFALSVYHSHMLIEKQSYKITVEPSGTEQDTAEDDLQRVSARDLMYALSLSITYN